MKAWGRQTCGSIECVDLVGGGRQKQTVGHRRCWEVVGLGAEDEGLGSASGRRIESIELPVAGVDGPYETPGHDGRPARSCRGLPYRGDGRWLPGVICVFTTPPWQGVYTTLPTTALPPSTSAPQYAPAETSCPPTPPSEAFDMTYAV